MPQLGDYVAEASRPGNGQCHLKTSGGAITRSRLAGGGGGKECAARHERSNDWPQGGAAPITRTNGMA